MRTQVFLFECVGMQASSIDLDAQQFLQPHIAEVNTAAKVIEKGELARFSGCFKHYRFEPERFDKAFGIASVQVSILIKQSDAFGTLARLDDELHGTSIEPFSAGIEPRRKRSLCETSVMFFAELHLNLEAATPSS